MSHTSLPTGSPRASSLGMGDLPTWIGAAGTVLGVVAAAIAAYFVYGQLSELREQARLQRKASKDHERELKDIREVQAKQLELINLEIGDRRSFQARQVKVGRSVTQWGANLGVDQGFAYTLTITNESHAPISNVMAKYPNQPDFDDGMSAECWYQLVDGRLAPGAKRVVTGEWLKSVRFPVPAQLVEQGQAAMFASPTMGEEAVKLLTGLVRFTDAGQRHWHIDEVGVLTEISERSW